MNTGTAISSFFIFNQRNCFVVIHLHSVFLIKGKPNDIKVALDIVNIPRLDEKDEVSIYKNNMIISNIRNKERIFLDVRSEKRY